MTPASPERAAYEAGRWPDVIPWEEAFPEVKDKFRAIAQAAIGASPELAEALAANDRLRDLLDEATRTMLNLGRHAEALLAHDIRKRAGIEA